MEITASMVKELREKSGAGMMDCKKALQETGGNMDKAMDYLREKGIAKAAKKADRIASEGLVEIYNHGGRIAAIVEVNSETDFVAKNDDFKQFCKDMAMQVAAAKPKYVSREQIPQEEIDHEKEVLTQQALNEGKPANIVEKMIVGRMEKFYEEICLLDQAFIKDPDKKIKDLLTDLAARIGENIQIRRFTRYELGEGIEKKEENFAEEVAKQIGK